MFVTVSESATICPKVLSVSITPLPAEIVTAFVFFVCNRAESKTCPNLLSMSTEPGVSIAAPIWISCCASSETVP